MLIDALWSRDWSPSRETPKSANWRRGSRLIATLCRTSLAWLASGALAVRFATVAVGCVLLLLLPDGLEYRVLAILFPLMLTGATHPRVRRIVVALYRCVSVNSGRGTVSVGARSLPLQMPGAPGSGTPTRAAYLPSKGAFLRSFDRLEAILQEALIIEIGEIATQFTLRDMVIYLEQSGFLTTADCRAWAECLSVRRSLLTAGGDRRTPSDAAVEGALATMLQLQVTLIDRRRTLFDEEQEIRDQENADLVTFAGKLHPDETA